MKDCTTLNPSVHDDLVAKAEKLGISKKGLASELLRRSLDTSFTKDEISQLQYRYPPASTPMAVKWKRWQDRISSLLKEKPRTILDLALEAFISEKQVSEILNNGLKGKVTEKDGVFSLESSTIKKKPSRRRKKART
jgi:hypothetical protein